MTANAVRLQQGVGVNGLHYVMLATLGVPYRYRDRLPLYYRGRQHFIASPFRSLSFPLNLNLFSCVHTPLVCTSATVHIIAQGFIPLAKQGARACLRTVNVIPP